jgi:hypothetical protein
MAASAIPRYMISSVNVVRNRLPNTLNTVWTQFSPLATGAQNHRRNRPGFFVDEADEI